MQLKQRHNVQSRLDFAGSTNALERKDGFVDRRRACEYDCIDLSGKACWRRVGLVALVVLLYLPALGAVSSATNPDESYYLGISAEMDSRDHWLTPTLDGQPMWFKPPLLYWAERICYAVFGRGFFAGRLPSALCAIAMVFLNGALAERMYGARAKIITILLIATSFGWIKFGRLAMMDAPMALAFSSVAWGSWRAAEEERPRQLLWVGVGAGATFMLKGPVGAVISLLLASGYLGLRRPALLFSRWTAAAFLLGAAIGLPWYFASFAVHGWRFYDFFVVGQNIDRFRHPWTWASEATLLGGFLVCLVPWTLLAIAAVPSLRRWREPGLLLPLVWIGAVLLVFTVPALKWPHYGLACVPAAVLLVAREPPPRWARVGTACLLSLVSVCRLAMLRWPMPVDAIASIMTAAVAFAAAAWLMVRDRLVAAVTATGLGAALVLAFTVPTLNKPVIPDAARTRFAGRPLFVYNLNPGKYTMAAGRPVHRVGGDTVERVLEEGGIVIFAQPGLSDISHSLRERLVMVESWPRLRAYLSPRQVFQSWLAGDPVSLFDQINAMEIRTPQGATSTSVP